jgi:hypothetical protein
MHSNLEHGYRTIHINRYQLQLTMRVALTGIFNNMTSLEHVCRRNRCLLSTVNTENLHCGPDNEQNIHHKSTYQGSHLALICQIMMTEKCMTESIVISNIIRDYCTMIELIYQRSNYKSQRVCKEVG